MILSAHPRIMFVRALALCWAWALLLHSGWAPRPLEEMISRHQLLVATACQLVGYGFAGRAGRPTVLALLGANLLLALLLFVGWAALFAFSA